VQPQREPLIFKLDIACQNQCSKVSAKKIASLTTTTTT
jgi:hypothetical protein